MLDLLGKLTQGSDWAPPGLSEKDMREMFFSPGLDTQQLVGFCFMKALVLPQD